MPVNPATIQQVNYRYPYYQPNFGENFASMLTAYLQGQQQKRQTGQENIQKVFAAMAPSLASQGQIKPGASTIGGIQYPWTVTPPSNNDWSDINAELLARERADKLKNPNRISPSTAFNIIGQTQAGLEALRQNPEEVMDSVARAVNYFNKKYGGEVTEELPDDFPDPKQYKEGQRIQHPTTKKWYQLTKGKWQPIGS